MLWRRTIRSKSILSWRSDELAEEQSIWVGFQIQLAPGWHIYWKNAGESGYPTTVGWELSKGWKAGTLQFPAPYLYEYEGMTGYALKIILLY